MIVGFSSSQLINAFISHVRNLEFGRCLNDLPRIQIGALEIQYCGTSSRQVLCLFHYIPCDRIGGRHLVLFRFHYLNKGISRAGPYGSFRIRRIKGIRRAVKNIMSTSFSEMVLSSCARAWRATAATLSEILRYRPWLNYRFLASLIAVRCKIILFVFILRWNYDVCL